MLARRHPTSFDALAEDRCYRDQVALPRPGLRLIGSIATVTGLILLVVGVAQA
jgi:hypothetical protein